jgi:hypothetical protein
MEPMEGYRPDLVRWRPHDFVIVTAVTWTDGTMAGDVGDGLDALMLDSAERVHVAQVTDAIRLILATPTETDPVAALKTALAAVPLTASDAEFQAAEARLPFADLLPTEQLRSTMDSVLRVRRQELNRAIDALITSRPAGAPIRTDADLLWVRRTLARFEAWAAALKR